LQARRALSDAADRVSLAEERLEETKAAAASTAQIERTAAIELEGQ
jgi:hypothetical protein